MRWTFIFIPHFKVSLNEGCHQLRLFNQGPNNVDPFTEHCLRDAHIRTIPCASLLVRLYKVPRGPKGKTLQVRLCVHIVCSCFIMYHQNQWFIHSSICSFFFYVVSLNSISICMIYFSFSTLRLCLCHVKFFLVCFCVLRAMC